MRTVTCLAPAKVNLALHVTGRRNDGFHELDTLVAFADMSDRLTVGPSDRFELAIRGPFSGELCGGEGNLVTRAWRALAEAAGEKSHPVRITLEKNLPVAGGIGGGSADAAATLLALSEYWRLGGAADLHRLAGELGSDVPMCLESRPLRARGRGELLEILGTGPDLPVLLVNPRIPTPTPAIFKALRSRDNPPISGRLKRLPDPARMGLLRNDLEFPARLLVPEIATVLATLRLQKGCLIERMSGSGSTCFAIFADRESAALALRAILDTYPQWWSVSANLLGGPMPERLTIEESQ